MRQAYPTATTSPKSRTERRPLRAPEPDRGPFCDAQGCAGDVAGAVLYVDATDDGLREQRRSYLCRAHLQLVLAKLGLGSGRPFDA
jgi:hypothetical protein